MKLADIRTPALVLELGRLQRNTRRMSDRARNAGVNLRPHMKTAKCAQVAQLAVEGSFGGVTVSTLAEAAYFADQGYRDVTYAVAMVPVKLDEVAAIQARGDAQVQVIVDDVEVVAGLAARAAALGGTYGVLVEIDSGEHRTGIWQDETRLLAVARAVRDAEHLTLEGVLTHGGHSYGCHGIEAVQAVAEQERRAVVDAAALLRDAGLPCATVSAGSTPTAVHGASFEGLTEIRPGVYVFFDLAQVGRGSCEVEDVAVSVLASVVGHQRPFGRVLVDAGGLALSKDLSANDFLPDVGYGWVFDELLSSRIGDLRVATTDQEHGFLEGSDPAFEALPVGSRVRVLPNHACMTAAAHQRYVVVDGSDDVIDVWDRVNGWWRD